MPRTTPTSVVVAWSVAVLGAVAIVVGPITPYLLVFEVVGVTTCLVACVVLAVTFFRD